MYNVKAGTVLTPPQASCLGTLSVPSDASTPDTAYTSGFGRGWHRNPRNGAFPLNVTEVQQ